MTLVEERPAPTPTPPEPAPTPTSPVATWALAARLARREVRRRPGRTILVMLLIVAPVAAMTLASTGARTLSDKHRDRFTEEYGNADVVVPAEANDVDAIVVPTDLASSDAIATMVSAFTPVLVATDDQGTPEQVNVQVLDIDLTNQVVSGLFEVTSGRAAVNSTETFITTALADELGIEVGDTLQLLRPDLERTVVGVGLQRTDLLGRVIVMPDLDTTILRTDRSNASVLVDLEGTPDAATAFTALRTIQDATSEVATEGRATGMDIGGFTRPGWSVAPDDEVAPRELAWGWVAGMLALAAVGVVIAAAFATTARRNLVTIGQLSANGAPERLLRRTLALQGTVTGALGAVAGVGVGVAVALLAARFGWWDVVANRDVGSARIAVSDLAVIAVSAIAVATAAAMLPARSAARVPVLTALAGRRPVGEPPRWLGRAGVAASLAGLCLLFVAAASDSPGDLGGIVALTGALGVLVGVVCSSPLLIAAVGRLANRVGGMLNGIVRLACRSLDRNRTRSAAVLTAISTVGVLATAGATSIGLMEARDWQPSDAELRTITIQFTRDYFQSADAEAEARANDGVYDRPPERATPLPDAAQREIERIAPDARLTGFRTVVIDPPPYNAIEGREFGISPENETLYRLSNLVLDDDATRDQIDLDDEQRRLLDTDGVLVAPWSNSLDNRYLVLAEGRELVIEPSGLGPEPVQFNPDSVMSPDDAAALRAWDGFDAIVTPEFVAEHDLELTTQRYLLEQDARFTVEQRDQIRFLLPGVHNSDAFVASASAPGIGTPSTSDFEAWEAYASGLGHGTQWALIHLAVAAVSLLFVLLVVAIGLTLTATESRDERNVLHAVGASPATLRRVAAAKAWVLCTCAAVVAIPAGYASMFVVGRATDSIGSAPFPTIVALSLLLAIPAIAAVATWLVSTIAQRRQASFAIEFD